MKKSPPKFWIFVVLVTILGTTLSGLLLILSFSVSNDSRFIIQEITGFLLLPQLVLTDLLPHSFQNDLKQALTPSGDGGLVGFVLIGFLAVLVECVASSFIFFAFFGILFWFGIYHRRRFLSAIIALLIGTYILAYFVSTHLNSGLF